MAQQQRAVATRAAILQAAAGAFVARGYAGTSLDGVAEIAGVTKGALYFHFRSKAALANAVIAEQHRSSRELGESVTTSASSAAEALTVLSASLAVQLTTDVMVSAGLRLTTEGGDPELVVAEPYVEWLDEIGGLVRTAVGEGDFRADLDVDRASTFFVGAYVGVQTLSGAITGRADVVERLADLLRYVLPSFVAPGREQLVESLPALLLETGRRAAP